MAKILVVEDDFDLRYLNLKLLEMKGYTSLGASSKAEVFEKLRSFTPEIILMDVMLGDDDGREICKQLRKQHPHAFVILVSAREDLLLSYKECGADWSFLKPYSLKAVLQKIEEALIKIKSNR